MYSHGTTFPEEDKVERSYGQRNEAHAAGQNPLSNHQAAQLAYVLDHDDCQKRVPREEGAPSAVLLLISVSNHSIKALKLTENNTNL